MYYIFTDYLKLDYDDVIFYGITTNNTWSPGKEQSPIWRYRNKNESWVKIMNQKARYYKKTVEQLKQKQYLKHKIIFQSESYEEAIDILNQHIESCNKSNHDISSYDYTTSKDESNLQTKTDQIRVNSSLSNNLQETFDIKDLIKVIMAIYLNKDDQKINKLKDFELFVEENYQTIKDELIKNNSLLNAMKQDYYSDISIDKKSVV
jgi:hypothetical protein